MFIKGIKPGWTLCHNHPLFCFDLYLYIIQSLQIKTVKLSYFFSWCLRETFILSDLRADRTQECVSWMWLFCKWKSNLVNHICYCDDTQGNYSANLARDFFLLKKNVVRNPVKVDKRASFPGKFSPSASRMSGDLSSTENILTIVVVWGYESRNNLLKLTTVAVCCQ